MTGQEALNKFVNSFAEYYVISQHQYLNATNMQTAVEYLARSEECRILEKSIKALEIIKEKNVDIRWIEVCDTVKDYNKGRDEHLNYELTEEEFNTLKEVLE